MRKKCRAGLKKTTKINCARHCDSVLVIDGRGGGGGTEGGRGEQGLTPCLLACWEKGLGLIPSSGVMEVTTQFFHGGGLFSTPSLEHHVASTQSPSSFSLCHQSLAGPDLNTQPAPWS